MKTNTPTMMIAITAGLLAAAPGCRPILDPSKHETEELGRSPDFAPPPSPIDGVRGTYEVTTTLDLTAASVAPEPANEALTTLAQLRDDPTALFFTLLETAGVPLVHELRSALPDVVEDQLADWIDAALTAAGLRDEVDAILTRAQTVLTQVDVVSIIDVQAPDADGYARAEHTVSELHWAPIDGVDMSAPVVVDISDSMDSWAESSRYSTEIVFGKHGFAGIEYGELAWQAINQQMIDRTGLDVRGHLGAVADCPAIAASVADNCILGQCVGHEATLTDLCELGLDAAVDQVHEQIAAYRFDGLILDSGAASVTSRGFPKGIWSARLDTGMGPREIPARFTATRL
jgi:hypothetical protein